MTEAAPADPAQAEGSVENALAALAAGDVESAQNELRAVLLVVQSDIETAEGNALVVLQENRSVRSRSADRARGGRPRERLGNVGGHTNGCRHNGRGNGHDGR